MQPADIDKKVSAIVGDDQRNQDRERKTVQAADGNPRLLEWLLQLTDVLDDEFLERLGGTVARFRENLLAEKLIGALDEDEKKALARMTLFQLPVPEALVTEMAHGASVQRAMPLGLLEKQGSQEENLYRVTTVLEPLLLSVLSEAEWTKSRRLATRKLYDVWWSVPEEPLESRVLEVVRLAMAAGEQEFAVVPADTLAARWMNYSRYLEAAALCRSVLAVVEDYRILGSLARAEQVLGEIDVAGDHYKRALALCPPSDEKRKSATIHNMASLEALRDNLLVARELFQESLEIQERIGELLGKSATLQQMAGIARQQGDTPGARNLLQQSLEIKDKLGDRRGKATTLHEMAVVIDLEGDTRLALELWVESLKIKEELGDPYGKAATLHAMAVVKFRQGDIRHAHELWHESLEIKKQIGDVQGEAATLHEMAGVIALQGDTPRAFELWRQAFEIVERIGDVRGSGGILAQMAWASGLSGQPERFVELNLRAAEALGAARAYLDLQMFSAISVFPQCRIENCSQLRPLGWYCMFRRPLTIQSTVSDRFLTLYPKAIRWKASSPPQRRSSSTAAASATRSGKNCENSRERCTPQPPKTPAAPSTRDSPTPTTSSRSCRADSKISSATAGSSTAPRC
jgi:tetratricopeptide (TPR) repeat protein